MKATENNLSRFLSVTDTQFHIPVYQRNYDWTLKHCQQLLNDIINVGKDDKATSHFIGSIVYIHDDVYSASSIRELLIIDGQQRLITVTLIYISLMHLAKDLNKQQMFDKINESYIINKFAKEEEKLKLKPTENNNKLLKLLIQGENLQDHAEYSKLRMNYLFFRKNISESNHEVILDGLNKLVYVDVALERQKDSPQKIFESLNSTGLALSQADLIRNYILMGLQPRPQAKFYNNYWKDIELLALNESNREDKVSDFVRDYLTMKKREIPNKSDVYKIFKDIFTLEGNVTEIENLLAHLKKYAAYFNKLLNPSKEPDKEIQNRLRNIDKLEINVVYPFLLEVYSDYDDGVIDKGTLIGVLDIIESYVWRRLTASLPSNALNKVFMRLYEDINKDDYLGSVQRVLVRKRGTGRFPNDKEIKSALREKDVYNIRNRTRSYFLEKLENYENREIVDIDGNENITVEHIFPQNPEPKWRVVLGEDEYIKIKDSYLDTIANLTLSGNNGKLGNKYFTDKRDMNEDNKEQGYKYSRLWLNRFLASCERWDLAEIEKRFDLIYERYLKIWNYPIFEETDNMDNDEINIFDAEDPTHKKLEYAIFLDQKKDIKNVAKLYEDVMKELFDIQPETFFTSEELCTKLSLTTDKEKLRKPLALNNTVYIEANLDSKDKFERIKLALNIFDIKDELLIKYATSDDE
ncbi:DUF262 domain-containing protein [Candidatus Magnetomonas plexicatena]|uniref:DUF262 domain-containing protein n=1 Tax=Candidatus Magnetomonas plexicatena TaxID=2552947 RepID=UPI001C76951C|nr:DUF262 domain-containing protein [Nitrospirales bacterium LBB_01]